ncbi:MAG: 1-deoxy-D-xylulose-5-phosphate reductoisomerase, partial [Pirellulales bacterium]
PLAAADHDWTDLPAGCELRIGAEHLDAAVAADGVDVVLAGIVGAAGLRSVRAALEAGKTVALANKEPLVMAGPLIREIVARTGAMLLPVDSEHSAVFQAMQAGRREEIRKIVLTASGGPFRDWGLEQLREVTVEDALAHPTWEMGPKITVDSATMMNKALEIVEARWLFDLAAEQISVVIHPQSIVHSMVEYVDGSVLAQLSPPDMKLPIQYALTYPERLEGVARRMDWEQAFRLEFEPPDLRRFEAIELGLEVARQGGSCGAVVNGANEAAVAAFLDRKLPFSEIVPAAKAVLAQHHFESHPTWEQLTGLDRWARQEVGRWIGC